MKVWMLLAGFIVCFSLSSAGQNIQSEQQKVHPAEELIKPDTIKIFVGMVNKFQGDKIDLIQIAGKGNKLVDVYIKNNIVSFMAKRPGVFPIKIKTTAGEMHKFLLVDILRPRDL